jgi:hypothetical protein
MVRFKTAGARRGTVQEQEGDTVCPTDLPTFPNLPGTRSFQAKCARQAIQQVSHPSTSCIPIVRRLIRW